MNAPLRRIARTCALLGALAAPCACSDGADVSVGRNDPVAGSNDPNRPNEFTYGPSDWDVPTTGCDTQSCQIGPECRVLIGDCDPHWGIAVGGCSHLPDACTDDVAPVCGCNGRSYGNPCQAAHAGVGIFRMTPCE